MPIWFVSLAFGGLGKLRAAVSWLARNPLVLAGLVAVGIIVFQHLELTHKDKVNASLRADLTAANDAAKIDRASNDRLTAAMSEQSAANRALNEASDKRLAAAQAALDAVNKHDAGIEALAAQIDATRAHSKAGGLCVTDKAVLAAKDAL